MAFVTVLSTWREKVDDDVIITASPKTHEKCVLRVLKEREMAFVEDLGRSSEPLGRSSCFAFSSRYSNLILKLATSHHSYK
jgi:hypothetical protein